MDHLALHNLPVFHAVQSRVDAVEEEEIEQMGEGLMTPSPGEIPKGRLEHTDVRRILAAWAKSELRVKELAMEALSPFLPKWQRDECTDASLREARYAELLREIAWAEVRETMQFEQACALNIRKGWMIVEIPHQPEMPGFLRQIFPGAPGGGE